MTYRRLGRSGIDVSLLSFGSHTDPADRVSAGRAGTVLTPQGQAKRDRIVEQAFDRGVNLLDVYENEGQWEPAARLVKGRRNKVLVSLAHGLTESHIDVPPGRMVVEAVKGFEYFTKWIDILTDQTKGWPWWRSEAEKAHVFSQYQEARRVYEQLAKEAQN